MYRSTQIKCSNKIKLFKQNQVNKVKINIQLFKKLNMAETNKYMFVMTNHMNKKDYKISVK